MQLTTESIAEFKQLYAEEHGVKLTNEQAAKEARDLLMLVKTIYKQIPKPTAKPSPATS